MRELTMKRLSYVVRQARQEEAVALKQKALEPQCRYCYIQKKDVNILVEYGDYKGPRQKGAEGAIYCENIVECYQANVRCRYSGLSPLYPDPFLPRDEEEPAEEEEVEETPEEQET